jgi:hypothetical protein
MAPPKPSAQTKFVLDAMAKQTEAENGKLDQILKSLDLLFERVTDVGLQQQAMKQQLEHTTHTVNEHSATQQHLTQHFTETGRVVA